VVLPVLILYFGRYEDYANQETQLAEERVRWAAVYHNPYASGQPIRVCVIAIVIFPSPIGAPSATIAQMATMRIEQVPTSGTNPWTSGNPTGTMPSQCLTS
jgi:hypothetical protein